MAKMDELKEIRLAFATQRMLEKKGYKKQKELSNIQEVITWQR